MPDLRLLGKIRLSKTEADRFLSVAFAPRRQSVDRATQLAIGARSSVSRRPRRMGETARGPLFGERSSTGATESHACVWGMLAITGRQRGPSYGLLAGIRSRRLRRRVPCCSNN